MRSRVSTKAFSIAAVALSAAGIAAADDQPWLDAKRNPDQRAQLAVAAMTLSEKIGMLNGPMALALPLPGFEAHPIPKEAIPSAGYVSGVPRLGIPALYETDASLGVVNPFGARHGDVATALPSGMALAATFNPELAYRAGALIGAEAHAKGFNVLLGGGVNLTRDPRNGRNFEYLGEDPLLAGILAGEAVRGTQDQHVISTVKHFALNAHETNRTTLDARIDKAALRESDLLSFQLAIERGHPGSVMCGYNLINGDYDCGNSWLLNDVLKRDWHYLGWVMSDWGAVHATDYAVHGLDQESGEQLDTEVFFGEPLQRAVKQGSIPIARIDDMVRRILRSMFAVGVVEHPAAKADIDYKLHAQDALEVARQGIVLLKNDGGALPLKTSLKRIAVIGGNAHLGVLSGAGSSQVTPSNGPSIMVPVGGRGMLAVLRNEAFFPSSPVAALRAAAPQAEVVFDSGSFPADAAALAASADVALVFATRHEMEGYDIPDLQLPNGQDALIDAVAAANPRTVVILETGNPVAMPWIEHVQAVLAAWYPGQGGGRAIADVLFGTVNPSGKLPITFPVSDAKSMRPKLPNLGTEPGAKVSVDYSEGANVGYRWYVQHGVTPLFPFGHGLSYAEFTYDKIKVRGGKTVKVQFDVQNTGSRGGADVPQIYLTSAAGHSTFKLIGFQRVDLKAGERASVSATVDPRLLADFDERRHRWIIRAGRYSLSVGHSSADLSMSGEATVAGSIQ
jgi:beta-glucosidase